MALKNAYTHMSLDEIFAKLQAVLLAHGAGNIAFNADKEQIFRSLSFTIEYQGRVLHIRIDAKIEETRNVLKQQRVWGGYSYQRAYQVAWKNILSWVESQMALVELGQGTLVQVLFPYLLNPKGQTTFEAWEQMNTLQETTKHQEVIEGESVLYTLDNPSTATRRSPPHV